MLAKLIVLDLKIYGKMLWKPLSICLLVLIASISTAGSSLYSIALIAGLFSLLVAGGFILYVMISHYARHFYGDQGYLIHTLPVTPAQRLWAKFISGFLLYIVAALILLSGAYFLMRAALGEAYDNFIRLGGLKIIVNYVGTPGLLLFLGLILFMYLSLFANYSLSISLGMNKYLQRFRSGGIAIVFIAIFAVQQLVNFISQKVPLSLRIFLNPRWYKMMEIVIQAPNIYEEPLRHHGIPSATVYTDIGLFSLFYSLAFLVISFVLVHRELKRINLR